MDLSIENVENGDVVRIIAHKELVHVTGKDQRDA